jgi:mycofactocin precursor
MVTARQASRPTRAPGHTEPEAAPRGAAGTVEEDPTDVVDDDVLVEDIVIDGMCGVY